MLENNSKNDMGSRIREFRKKAGLSRAQFEERFGVSQRTLKSFENGQNPLNETKITLFKNIFSSIGYDLLQELSPSDTVGPHKKALMLESTDINVKFEIDYFKEKNPDYVLLTLSNKSMYPIYNVGDIIGGIKISDQSLYPKFFGTVCIVLDSSDEKYVGRLLKHSKTSAFITPLNNDAAREHPIQEIKEVESIAQVTRHWCLYDLVRV